MVSANEDGEEEISAYIKYGEFIHRSGDHQLLRKNCASCVCRIPQQ